jgi:hypothetical protein
MKFMDQMLGLFLPTFVDLIEEAFRRTTRS